MNPRRARILFFTPYDICNVDSGGARRSALFHDILTERCEVEVVAHTRSFAPPPNFGATHHVPLRSWWRRIHDPHVVRVLDERFAVFKPDLAWIESFYSAPMVARAAHRYRVPVLYNSQNVESERFRAWSPLHRILVRAYESHCLKVADVTAFVSETDRALAAELYGFPESRAVVFRNGYDEARFHPPVDKAAARQSVLKQLGLPEGAFVALFMGNHRYRPNIEAFDAILYTIAPKLATAAPRARIVIAGPGLERRIKAPANVVLHGFAPDIVPLLQGADVLICPLRHGGGTRLKIIEALACGLPVLSTPKGAEGLDDLGEPEGLYRVDRAEFSTRIAVWAGADGALPGAQATPALEVYSKRVIAKAVFDTLDRILLA